MENCSEFCWDWWVGRACARMKMWFVCYLPFARTRQKSYLGKHAVLCCLKSIELIQLNLCVVTRKHILNSNQGWTVYYSHSSFSPALQTKLYSIVDFLYINKLITIFVKKISSSKDHQGKPVSLSSPLSKVGCIQDCVWFEIVPWNLLEQKFVGFGSLPSISAGMERFCSSKPG